MKKILIIEDELTLRAAYMNILTKEGFKAYAAADGETALSHLEAVKPDLILLDIMMPNVDGLEFLKRAHLPQKFPHTKVIAFSNLSDQHKLDEMLKLGATRHILKSSLSPKQLIACIRELLR